MLFNFSILIFIPINFLKNKSIIIEFIWLKLKILAYFLGGIYFMEEITIYTDGACSGNPGPGGWAAVLMLGDNKKKYLVVLKIQQITLWNLLP